jgi:hypothetical protein
MFYPKLVVLIIGSYKWYFEVWGECRPQNTQIELKTRLKIEFIG